eukprot:1160568-Pelagomonas_calceolata.AAC.13
MERGAMQADSCTSYCRAACMLCMPEDASFNWCLVAGKACMPGERAHTHSKRGINTDVHGCGYTLVVVDVEMRMCMDVGVETEPST